MKTAFSIVLALSLVSSVGASRANDRHDLLREQQQDALDLELRHDALRSQPGLSPSDRQKIDWLRSEQRLEQQRLELDQLQRQRALGRTAPSFGDQEIQRRLYLQQDAFRTERQLQSQRFYLEQQQLMQSVRPPALQPLPTPGALRR